MEHFEIKCGVFQNVVQQAIYTYLINCGGDYELKDVKEGLETSIMEVINEFS